MTSELFRFATPAGPEQVWEALTRGDVVARYLYGLQPKTTWRPGDRVVSAAPGPMSIDGEVLAVQRPVRLSYTLRSGDGQPSTYLTWEIREAEAGAVVRLYVDEPDGAFDGAEELEDVWLGVLAGLQSLLIQQLAPTSTDAPAA